MQVFGLRSQRQKVRYPYGMMEEFLLRKSLFLSQHDDL